MALSKAAMMFSIPLIFGGIGNMCCNAMDFQSDQLEEISNHISIEWPQGDSTFTVKYGKRDIVVRVSDGCVQHIGFRIFPEQLRSRVINQAIADFVERYWLRLTLPLKREKSFEQQLTEDRFVFLTGNTASIDAIQGDTTLVVSCSVTPELVTMAWGRIEGAPRCCITFPVNHELILGRRMPENDRRLPQEINSVKIKYHPKKSIGTTLSLTTDSLSSLWIEHTGSYLADVLKNERYYTCGTDGVSLEPVFDVDRCLASIANMFTDYDIEKASEIKLSICHKIFGLKEQQIDTTVQKFVAYSLQNGCVPYVGIVSVDKDNSGLADVLVIMHNHQLGYNHVLRATVPLDCISTGDGTCYARLNAFVPSSNIKNLFND